MKGHPEYDCFTVPEGQRIFKEPGRYTVVIGGGLGVNDTVEIQVYPDGNYSILEEE